MSCLLLRNGNCTNNGIARQTNCIREENCVNSVEEADINSNSSCESVSDTSVHVFPEVFKDVPTTLDGDTFFDNVVLKAYGNTLAFICLL